MCLCVDTIRLWFLSTRPVLATDDEVVHGFNGIANLCVRNRSRSVVDGYAVSVVLPVFMRGVRQF